MNYINDNSNYINNIYSRQCINSKYISDMLMIVISILVINVKLVININDNSNYINNINDHLYNNLIITILLIRRC